MDRNIRSEECSGHQYGFCDSRTASDSQVGSQVSGLGNSRFNHRDQPATTLAIDDGDCDASRCPSHVLALPKFENELSRHCTLLIDRGADLELCKHMGLPEFGICDPLAG